jgi:hypothetical protein
MADSARMVAVQLGFVAKFTAWEMNLTTGAHKPMKATSASVVAATARGSGIAGPPTGESTVCAQVTKLGRARDGKKMGHALERPNGPKSCSEPSSFYCLFFLLYFFFLFFLFSISRIYYLIIITLIIFI